MPDELQQKMRNASLFNKGYEMSELLSAALLDMRWHCTEENEAMQDVDDFELRALVAENMDLPAIPPRYRSSYFAHIFGGGYAAGYYAYLWTQMLVDDGYQWFVEQGGLTRENGLRFREAILSRGNSEDLERLYRQWRGKAPQIMPMLQHRGERINTTNGWLDLSPDQPRYSSNCSSWARANFTANANAVSQSPAKLLFVYPSVIIIFKFINLIILKYV